MALFNAIIEHDGESLLSFTGILQSPSGRGFSHLYGKRLVLDIEDGPALDVVITRIDKDEAIVQLLPP